MSPQARISNFLIFSDVHLGSDLVQHVRPWTVSRLKELARIDRDLASMIDHYRTHADPDRPWRLIIAGDLVDFIGMSIAPKEGVELTQEERLHGLGSSPAHAVLKMRAVAERHAMVFDRLAAFVADGHSLVLVPGNHDVDFHWREAQQAFLDALLARRPELADDEDEREDFADRVEFHPWFYYEEGLLFVEHGHQYDAMCSYHHPLAPVSPEDEERICWSPSDILLRSVARPTPGLTTEGHESFGVFDYLKLAASLGVIGAFRLVYRYAAAVGLALRRWRAHLSERARAIRADNERRMEDLAWRMRIGMDELQALLRLHPGPVTRGFLDVLRSVYLDRVLFGLLTTTLVVALGVLLPVAWWVPLAVLLIATTGVFLVRSSRRRLEDIDPRRAMRRGAERIAELFEARWVVMGHTHEPLSERLTERSTYVNVGHWGVDDPENQVEDAPRTHLVLRWVDGEHRAEFLRWDPVRGPLPQPISGSERARYHG